MLELRLTDRLEAPKRADGRWAAVSAVSYYWNAAVELLTRCGRGDGLEGGFYLSLVGKDYEPRLIDPLPIIVNRLPGEDAGQLTPYVGEQE